MLEESDGIEEVLEGQLRVLVTAAGLLGERRARAREEAVRAAEARSEKEYRELESRIAAEWSVGRAELANVGRGDWWDRATPEEIGHAYEVACAWCEAEPEAVRAQLRIREELRARYGIDISEAEVGSRAVRERVSRELDRAARARAGGVEEKGRAAGEQVEAQRLLAQAARDEARAGAMRDELSPDEQARVEGGVEELEGTARRAREEGRAVYDSAQRRAGTAGELEAKGISGEVVATRMRADVSQAKPATEAVTEVPVGRGGKVRRMLGRGVRIRVSGRGR